VRVLVASMRPCLLQKGPLNLGDHLQDASDYALQLVGRAEYADATIDATLRQCGRALMLGCISLISDGQGAFKHAVVYTLTLV
jgi:hypothetical protein